jgi:hypothetical protein
MSKKPLPTIQGPTLNCELPVSKKKIKYRAFNVREQKALMLANESQDHEVIYDTVRELVLACTSGELDTSLAPSADVAYFFVQLRIQSVGPELKFSMKCDHCEESVIINYSLESLAVDMKDFKTNVDISDGIGLQFRVPSLADAKHLDVNNPDSVIKMLYVILEMIYDENQVYEKSDYTFEEFRDWIENFNDDQLDKIYEWVSSIPELRHELNFVCNHCQQQNSKLLEGLHSFFRLGDDA